MAVAMKRDGRLNNRELVVVPEDMSLGLLYAMHLNLNHPSQFQMMKVVDTRFFMLDREQKIRDITKQCTLCQSVSKLPEEIHTFKSNIMPPLCTCKAVALSLPGFSASTTSCLKDSYITGSKKARSWNLTGLGGDRIRKRIGDKTSKYLLRMYLMTCLLRKRGQSSFCKRQSPIRRPTFLNAFNLTSVGRA